MDPINVNLENLDFGEYNEFDDLNIGSNEGASATNTTTNTDGTSISGGPRKRARRSEAWNVFTLQNILKNGETQQRAVCKYCKIDLAPASGTTGHLLRHAKKCLAKHSSTNDPRQTQLNVGQSGSSLTTFSYNQSHMREGMAILTAQTEIPFTFGADSNFEYFQQKYVNPQFQSVSRNTIRSDSIKVYTQLKKELIYDLSKNCTTISCTSDTWEGRNHLGFFCLTAHFIDSDWMLQKRIIAFRMMEYPHDGQQIYQSIMSVFREYGVINKIFSMTFDNHFANTASIDIFHRNLQSHHGKILHLRCVCHILNLIVKDGLSFFEDNIQKIRNALLHIRSSNSRAQDFAKFCKISYNLKPRQFVTDTQHRWNTTYLMLESCKDYKFAITEYIDRRNIEQLKLVPEDWEIAYTVMDFLKVFYDATNICSGVYYSTSCRVLTQLYYIALKFKDYRYLPMFEEACIKMEAKFRKYWADMPSLFVLASIMDPRIKDRGVEILLRGISDCLIIPLNTTMSDVNTLLHDMFNVYESKYSSATSSSSSSSSFRGNDPFWSQLARGSQSGSVSARSELFRYLETNFTEFLTHEEMENFNVLEWWKLHKQSFPVLTIMARDLLTPPVSTVASESAFSAGNRVLDERRTRLTPDILETLMCLKDWEDARRRQQDALAEMVQEFSNLDIDIEETQ